LEAFVRGICCARLMGEEPRDPYYQQAVALLEQAAHDLDQMAQGLEEASLYRLVVDSYRRLALCHWQAGDRGRAQEAQQDQVRLLTQLHRAQATQPRPALPLTISLVEDALVLEEAKQPTALVVARRAAAAAGQCNDLPATDTLACANLGNALLPLAGLLCRLNCPTESLAVAEQARLFFEKICREQPKAVVFHEALSEAWQRIGKARWRLKEREGAMAAFREYTAIRRRLLEQAPSQQKYRRELSRCYDRLAYYSRERGDRAGAAAALREWAKLWSDDAAQLTNVAKGVSETGSRGWRGRKASHSPGTGRAAALPGRG
jgi:hypothetical protein